jgi:16S rRNA processing protein RimM
MQKQFLEAGKIVSTHGLNGDFRCENWCDSADVFTSFEEFYLKDNDTEEPLKVLRSSPHKNIILLKFKGIDHIDNALPYVGKTLYINREQLKLDDGVYFIQDLIGLEVIDCQDGNSYGYISDVFFTGANDVYEVTNKETGKKHLIPAINEVIIKTDLHNNIMTIKPIKGMFDDEN